MLDNSPSSNERELPAQCVESDARTFSPTPRIRGEEVIARLEELASPCMHSAIENDGRGSSRLETYSLGMNQIDIKGIPSRLKGIFPDVPILAADIGGSRGTAALELERAGCTRCFVIDPGGAPAGRGPLLPNNRFICREAENLEGIPNECFQLVVSFGTLNASANLTRAIQEITRVLMPGGIALIDIQYWHFPRSVNALKSVELPADAQMKLITRDSRSGVFSGIPLSKALESVVPPFNSEGGSRLNLNLGSCFSIDKKSVSI